MVANEFKENVASGSIVRVRSALLDDLIIDRSFSTFEEELSYAEERGMSVFEAYDFGSFAERKSWNEDYLNQQKVALMLNFSRERVDHIKEVIKAVMPDASTGSASEHHAKSQTGHSRTGVERYEEEDYSSAPIVRQTNKSAKTGRREKDRTAAGQKGKANEKTGTKVITEEEVFEEQSENSNSRSKFDAGAALIVCGAAAVVVGAVIPKGVVIGTGVVAAGVGCVLKATRKKTS